MRANKNIAPAFDSRRRQSSLPAPVQIKKPRTRRGFQICARRESNPHFQLRRLTLYPLNYERDKAVVSFILQNYARPLEKITKMNHSYISHRAVFRRSYKRTGPFPGVPISAQGAFVGVCARISAQGHFAVRARGKKSKKSGVGGFRARAEFARKPKSNGY